MICQLLLTSSLTVVLVSGHRYTRLIEAQPRIGYSTNVVHTYPGFDDLIAESAINVNLPHQHSSLLNLKNRGGTKYLPTSSNKQSYIRTSVSNEPKNLNLFNVGYNLSFSGNSYAPKKKEQRYTHVNNKKFENAEVITGRLKKNEQVRAPSMNSDLSPQDFVSNALLKQKQLTRYTNSPVSTKMINTKHILPVREQVSKYPSQSSTFTYNTQQNIFKDIIKATRPDPIQLSPDFRTSYNTRSRWKSANFQDPNKNFDQALESKHTNAVNHMRSNFNHEVALKNSESFDFSNAHGEIKFGDILPQGSEQYSHTIKGFDTTEPTSALNNLNIEAHIPQNLRSLKPLPLDTSLLKEPILTTGLKESAKDDQTVPIHFDIRPIQTVMQTELNKIHNFATNENTNDFQQAQNYKYPTQVNYGLKYEDHDLSSSQTNGRLYGTPEAMDTSQYNVGLNYGKEYANYEEDIYKIVSLRPPPIISKNLRYQGI